MNGLATGFEFLLALVLMLGVVVTVHELGHFWAAKACGVRVLKFSVGFGNPIGFGRYRLRWLRKGTEYVVAWFPLGGFVKMLGEATDDQAHGTRTAAPPPDSLAAQPLWKKLTIIFAGPVMNLVLPVVVVAASLFVGVERRDATVGTVEPGSPAAEAGIRPDDRVLALDDEPVSFWDELERAVRERPGAAVSLTLARDGERFERTLAVRERPGLDLLGQKSDVGWLGLQHHRQSATLGVLSPDAPGARGGLRSGDRVIAVGDTAVEDWNDFASAYAAARGEVVLRVSRGEGEAPEEVALRVPALGDVAKLGVIPAVVLVAAVSEGMPATEAGIRPGDLLVAVDGEPVGSFGTFRETVLASEGRPLQVTVARGGETLVLTLEPRLGRATPEDPLEQYLIGISAVNAILPGPPAIDRVRNPFVAVPRAVVVTVETTGTFLTGLGRIVSGDISRRSIGGPIEIARQSHLALQRGWESFVSLLVIISINLGILNLLPIPILDGVDLDIGRGETFGLVGESGCGKSTLGRTVKGIYPPTAGTIRFDGRDITRHDRDAERAYSRRMQMIFQDPFSSLNPRMTVRELIGEGLEIHRIGTRTERRERIEEMMSLVGLNPEYMNRFPHEFSGGQRQRIAIARALVLSPDFVICDEPISALDVSIQGQIVNLLKDLQRRIGLTYLFIAHDLSMVKYISDRVGVMYLGRLVEVAPKRELFDDPRHPYTQALLSSVPIPDPKRERQRIELTPQGELPSPMEKIAGCAFRTRCPHAAEACARMLPELTPVAPGHSVMCTLHGTPTAHQGKGEQAATSHPSPLVGEGGLP